MERLEEAVAELRESQRAHEEATSAARSIASALEHQRQTGAEQEARCSDLEEHLRDETKSKELLALDLYKTQGSQGFILRDEYISCKSTRL